MGSGASKNAAKFLADKYPEKAVGSHDFYFICADKLLEFPTTEGPLPAHQELRERDGWLVKETISFYILLKGGYQDKVMISHRWITPGHPDPNNEQIKQIQQFLKDNPQVKMIWLDYGCIPQGRRNENHENYFQECLHHVSLLYLSLPVMIIYDKQYGSRFWCNLEMYLALRSASIEGIGPASSMELDSRFHFYCIGSAQHSIDKFKAAEIHNWKDLNVWQATEVLKEDDIMVTNKRDKDIQLEKLAGFDCRIKEILLEKKADMESMTKQRLKELRQARSTATKLQAAEEKVANALKVLKEAELELAGIKDQLVGFSSIQDIDDEVKALESLLVKDGVVQVWSTCRAFLAKSTSGKCVAWGDSRYGADLTAVQAVLDTDGVDQVWSTGIAFVAKLTSGKYVAWGDSRYGADLTAVQSVLDTDGVDQVWSTFRAFLAKLTSGKYVAWGNSRHGADLTTVQAVLDTDGVDQVWSTGSAFVAKLTSGKYVAWGDSHNGADLTAVQAVLDTDGVDQVWSTSNAFLAKLTSGKCVAWGDSRHGADITALQAVLDTDGSGDG